MAPKAPATLPLDDWHHKKGFEITTKYKNAIRQLHWYGKVPICALIIWYKDPATRTPLLESTIRKILGYLAPKRKRPNRRGPVFKLLDTEVDEVILYYV
jgi:hypothetical protein